MIPFQYPTTGHIHPYPTGEDILDLATPPFRVWIPKETILVLGYSQESERELNLSAVKTAGIPVYKRKGGGGAVLLTSGTVCVALRLKRDAGFGIHDYFSVANGMIQTALREELKINLEARGISDLAFQDRKVLGSSLYLARECAVYLASILVEMDLALFDEFLRHPGREPDYRKGRSHAEFVRNLNDFPEQESLTAEKVREILESGLSSAAF